MTRSGTAFQLRPLAPRTSVIASGSSLLGPNSDGLWPTPTTGDHSTRFKQGGMPLGMAVRMWPTPTVQDAEAGGHSVGLNDQVGGQLNPQWVEWLMGYPSGWTDLEDSATQ